MTIILISTSATCNQYRATYSRRTRHNFSDNWEHTFNWTGVRLSSCSRLGDDCSLSLVIQYEVGEISNRVVRTYTLVYTRRLHFIDNQEKVVFIKEYWMVCSKFTFSLNIRIQIFQKIFACYRCVVFICSFVAFAYFWHQDLSYLAWCFWLIDCLLR